jgi:hypothetical protein
LEPSVATVGGIAMELRFIHCSNTDAAKVVICISVSNTTVFKFIHNLNALGAIDVILFGNVIERSSLHKLNENC